VKLRNEQGFDALDAAGFGGCAMCAHKLIRAGLNPKTVRHDGFNVLHRAMFAACPHALLFALAWHTPEQKSGRSARSVRDPLVCLFLRMARLSSDPAPVCMLIHVQCSWGDESSHTDTVRVLLEAGVSPSKPARVPGQGLVLPLHMGASCIFSWRGWRTSQSML
jgi:hypothetical protein